MTPTQESPSALPLLSQEHSIRTTDSGAIDRFVTEIYALMDPALKKQGFVNPEFRIPLALHEAVVNAWKHGNQKDAHKAVTVRWRLNENLVLEVMDQGLGFDSRATADPRADENICKSCGRGIAIITYLADQVSWQDHGRHLIATFGKTPPQDKHTTIPS